VKRVFCLVCLFLGGCVSSRVVSKPGVDISGFSAIGIVEQADENHRSVTDELARQLIQYGYSVKIIEDISGKDNIDAYFVLNVTQYLPDKKYLVQLSDDAAQRDVILVNPTIELPGKSVYSQGTPFGLGEESKIIVSNATVGLSGRLVDSKTDEVLWSNIATYEGLDLESAIHGVVLTVVKKFPKKVN